MTSRLRPLTARILEALPGPRALWICAWALIPWLNAGANLLLDTEARSAIWDQSSAVIVLNYAALSVAVVITLWGTERIARRLEELRSDLFRELNATTGPLVASVAGAIAFGVSALVDDGWVAAVLRGTTWLLLGIALWTFLWTYAILQLGLVRLGREQLRPDAASLDPGLGLRPFGGVAFMGLWMLLAALVPVVLTGLPDVVGFVIGMVLLAAGVGAFVLSLWGLHRQMVNIKENELALARELYAAAYEPVRKERTLEALERQHSLLGPADALEKRARAIHDWPVSEGTWAWLIGIATSVVAVACARLILRALGF